MSKTEKRIFSVAALLLVLVVALFMVSGRSEKKGGIYRMSVIYSAGDSAKNLRKGLDSAALDMNIDLRIIQLDSGVGNDSFIGYIEQELAGDADAVILLPIESTALDAWLNAYNGATPLVVLGGRGIPENGLPQVGVNDYDMGYSLGLYISEKTNRVDLYANSLQSYAASQRTAGLIDALGKMRVMVTKLDAGGTVRGTAPAAVTSSDSMLNRLAGEGSYESLYGFDRSTETLYALEEGRITALAVYSDFDLGYRGVEAALARAKGGRSRAITLKHYIVNKDNMFEPPYEQVVLPIG